MMRTRTIQAAVIALALAASAAIVHAGGGGEGGIAGTFLFDCYLINGTNPPQELTVDDQFFPFPNPSAVPPIPDGRRTGVLLGKAKLLCTPAGASVTKGDLQPGDFSDAGHIKCYEAPPKSANPNVPKVVADPFVTETVLVGVPQYICVGAFKCDVGTACGPGAE